MIGLTSILAVLGAVLAYQPRWTRPDLYFAVTVGTDFASTPQGRRILHQYWLEVALHTLIAWCLGAVLGMESPWAPLPAIGWQLFGSGWAIARAHRATAQFAAAPRTEREALLSGGARKMPGGWPLSLGPLIFLGAAAVYARVFWDELPQRIAVHWGMQGADRWVERTPAKVAGVLAMYASLCVVFLLLSYGVMRWSRTISVRGERARGEGLFRRGTVWMLVGLPYLVVIPGVSLAFWPGMPAGWPWPAALLAVTLMAVIALMRMGQGGSGMVDRAEYQPPVGDHTPDAAWKWGLVYYNPEDPALIVEKRFGLGYTFNFGNRWSWVLMAVILLPAALAIALA